MGHRPHGKDHPDKTPPRRGKVGGETRWTCGRSSRPHRGCDPPGEDFERLLAEMQKFYQSVKCLDIAFHNPKIRDREDLSVIGPSSFFSIFLGGVDFGFEWERATGLIKVIPSATPESLIHDFTLKVGSDLKVPMLQRIAAGELSELDKRLYRRKFINLTKASDEAIARNDYAPFRSLFKNIDDLYKQYGFNVIEVNANEANDEESDPSISPTYGEPEEFSDEDGNDGVEMVEMGMVVCTCKKTLDKVAYHIVLRMAIESIQQKHWTQTKEVLKVSMSLGKFLQLANSNVSLIDLNESDDAWPGAFASVRRHQEAILHVDTVTQRRKASPVSETRISSPERLKQTLGRTIAKIGIRNPLPIRHTRIK
ncbi:hypothetical protein Aspvir_009717 [Aspergillus viridinutans]|uniref:Uncharacterized protein n=1 Tax=Aspergillus viridinutans TaxID=75553 RepID=A0A9P3C896_ASPVI|nr:uncharacterized protein Aspvir_009717 [Aspergillus viridinutans]GIK05604.1 hypothetical protein Aspvir_009717 [Aspergillus viridinutans]